MKRLRTYHPKMIQILSAVVVIVVVAFLMLNMLISKMIGSMVLDKNLEYVDNICEKIKQEIDYMQEKASSVFNYLQYSGMPQAFFEEDGGAEDYELLELLHRRDPADYGVTMGRVFRSFCDYDANAARFDEVRKHILQRLGESRR